MWRDLVEPGGVQEIVWGKFTLQPNDGGKAEKTKQATD